MKKKMNAGGLKSATAKLKKKSYGGTKKMNAGGGKPDYLDLDGDGNKKEPMKQAAKQKKMGGGYMQPSKEVKFGGPSKMQEGGVNYPVYAKGSEQAKSFRKAYAAAAAGSVFTWEGRKYKKEGAAPTTSAPKTSAGKAKTVDTRGSSTMDKVAKGDTSGATKVKPSARAGSKERAVKRAGRKADRAGRKADRKSGAAKVSRMENRNVKKVGKIQSKASAKASREEKRTERKAPKLARRAAVKGARAQMKENIRAAKGKTDKKFLGGISRLAGAVKGFRGGKGQGLKARLAGAAKGAAGGGMMGRAIGAMKGAAGAGKGSGFGGRLRGAFQGARQGAFGQAEGDPMAQQGAPMEENMEAEMRRGGKRKGKKMKDRRRKK